MKAPIAISLIAAVLGFAPHAAADTLQTIVLSATQPSTTGCVAPPAQNSFSATGGNIYEYFVIQNMNAGDKVSAHWIAPGSQWAWTTTWNPLSGAGNYCWTGGYLPSSEYSSSPGGWQIQVDVNGIELGQFSFTVTGGDPPPPPPPSGGATTCGAFSDTGNIYPCCSNGGNCTWWVWYQAQINWGVNLPNWGFAYDWWNNARSSNSTGGYTGSPIPAVSTIAVNPTFNGTGHVAWVTQVNSDGSVLVSEMNCSPSQQYPSQQNNKYYPPNWFTNAGGGFIYPKGPEAAPVLTSMYPSAITHSSSNTIVYFYGVNLNYPRGVYVTFPDGGHAVLSGPGQIPFYGSTYVQVEMTLNATGWWTVQVVNYDGGTSSPYSFYVH